MELILVRHGTAEPLKTVDEQRALTQAGSQDAGALGLFLKKKQTLINKAFVSPYLRTEQTFEQIAQAFNQSIDKESANYLIPSSSPSAVVQALAQHPYSSILVVTHQPLISSLLSYLVEGTSSKRFQYPMQPGDCACLTMFDWSAGGARLDNRLTVSGVRRALHD